jgi:hypothetical protein
VSDRPDRLETRHDLQNRVIAQELKDAPTDIQKQFLDMIKEQRDTAALQRVHRCWFFVPSPTEWERLKAYAVAPDYDKCPKCKKGRLVVEVYNGNIGQGWTLVCRRDADGCDFKEYVSDPE